MEEETYRKLFSAAESIRSKYGRGYRRGLNNFLHGNESDLGHAFWMQSEREEGRGYRDGFAAKKPSENRLTGSELKKIRVETLGLTQKELAAFLGVSLRTIIGWEQGGAPKRPNLFIGELERIELLRLVDLASNMAKG